LSEHGNSESCSWRFIFSLCFLPVCAVLTSDILAGLLSFYNQALAKILSLVFLVVILSTVVFSFRSHVQQYSFPKIRIFLHIVVGFVLGMFPLLCLKFLISLQPDKCFFSPMFTPDDPVKTITIVIAAFFLPIYEELYIRGILYSIIRKKGIGVFLAAAMASFAFSVAHLGEPLARKVLFFIFSMVLCFFYEKTRSLVLTLSIHVGSNLAVFLL